MGCAGTYEDWSVGSDRLISDILLSLSCAASGFYVERLVRKHPLSGAKPAKQREHVFDINLLLRPRTVLPSLLRICCAVWPVLCVCRNEDVLLSVIRSEKCNERKRIFLTCLSPSFFLSFCFCRLAKGENVKMGSSDYTGRLSADVKRETRCCGGCAPCFADIEVRMWVCFCTVPVKRIGWKWLNQMEEFCELSNRYSVCLLCGFIGINNVFCVSYTLAEYQRFK